MKPSKLQEAGSREQSIRAETRFRSIYDTHFMGRQNEGIEDAVNHRMILLEMGGFAAIRGVGIPQNKAITRRFACGTQKPLIQYQIQTESIKSFLKSNEILRKTKYLEV